MEPTEIPSQAWDLVLTWIPRVCTCMGAIVLGYWWKKGRLPTFGQETSRRIDDRIFERVLNSQDNMSKAFNNLADALREQGRDMCTAVQGQTSTFGEALRALHERLDLALSKRH